MRRPDLFVDPMRLALAAEFETEEDLRAAVDALRDAGYVRIDAYTPYLVDDLHKQLGLPRPRIPLAVLVFALIGAATGFVIQWWTNAVDYPINVGGRPLNAWPAFLIITFETAVLFGALAAFLGVILGSRLPEPWNPLFEIDGFERVTLDRYWIGIDEREARLGGARHAEHRDPPGTGPRDGLTEAEALLHRHGALRIVHPEVVG